MCVPTLIIKQIRMRKMKQIWNTPSSLKFRHVLAVSGCCFARALQKHELCWAKASFSQPKLYRQYFSSVIQANVIKPELSLHRKHSSNNPLWPLPNVLMKMPKNDSEILICWGSLFDAHVILSAEGSERGPWSLNTGGWERRLENIRHRTNTISRYMIAMWHFGACFYDNSVRWISLKNWYRCLHLPLANVWLFVEFVLLHS